MRNLTALILGGAALGFASAAAAQSWGSGGETPGWYVGGEAGWSHLNDPKANIGANHFRVDPSEGYALGVNGGYAFASGLRVEGELVHRGHDVDRLNFSGPAIGTGSQSGSGDISSSAIMGNVLYDFLSYGRWTPYLGGGVGAARVAINDLKFSGAKLVDDDDIQFAYQGIAGVKYAINPSWSANIDYRYFATLDPTFKSTSGTTFRSQYRTHNIMLGIAYHFAPPPPPPPAQAAPAAAPAAPPPSQARTFLVFFDFDKATLTPEGARVVQQAATAYKTTGSARLDVSGYTDTSGTAQYNLGLSKRRADTVRTALERAGVPNSAIVETWHGKENPRVPTPDGVREPQNRRVEILLPHPGQPSS